MGGAGIIEPGNLLSLSDAFRRKSVDLGSPVLEQMARETTELVGNLSHYYTEYDMNESVNREVSASLQRRVAHLRRLAVACAWPKLVLPLHAVEANTHYRWMRDAVRPRLGKGLSIQFQRGAYLGPPIEPEDVRRDVKTVFSDGYRGLVHLAPVYGPCHPQRQRFLPGSI